MRAFCTACLVSTLMVASPPPAPAQARPAAAGQSGAAGVPGRRANAAATCSVTIQVALVGENLTIKPVPLHQLRLLPESGDLPIEVRTGLDGTIAVDLVPGRYAVVSAAPVVLGDSSYRWIAALDALPGNRRLELTNANATAERVHVDSIPAISQPVSAAEPASLQPQPAAAPQPAPVTPPPARARQMAPEMEVYRSVRAGVLRIEAGLSQGSGFLVDSAGYILTNAHVIAGELTAAGVFDSATRLPLQIVYRDNDADVAVLRVAPSRAAGRPVLPLAQTAPLVEPGERVFAIGYPLHQEQTMTSGIVSSVRDGAIISDVNINHGNSGGPMMNLAGEVVAINTFGDFTEQGGPGISGAVVISRALQPLVEARRTAAKLPPPDTTSLPLLPSGHFLLQDLKAFADSVPFRRYAAFDSISIGKFFVTVTTPPIHYVRARAFEAAVAKDRKKREDKAGIDTEARFSEMREFRDWMEYVGDERAPVVTLTVEPKVGETSGSVFRRLLVTGPGGKATFRYAGDLQEARVYRNGVPVSLLRGGTTPVKQYVDNRWIDLKDVANYGYYVLPSTAFAPDADGTPPSVVIDLADLKNPTFPGCRELPREVTASVWNDFVLYYRAAGGTFMVADAGRKPNGPEKDEVCRQSRQLRGALPADAPAPSAMGGAQTP
jgi:putative serine protease PepD